MKNPVHRWHWPHLESRRAAHPRETETNPVAGRGAGPAEVGAGSGLD